MCFEQNICLFDFLTQQVTIAPSLFLALCLLLDTQGPLPPERIESNTDTGG